MISRLACCVFTAVFMSASALVAEPASTLTPKPAPAPQLPTLSNLFGPSFLNYATLSPDGKKLAATASWDGDVSSLLIIDLETLKPSALQGTPDLDIYRVYWQNVDRLLFNVAKDKLYSLGLYSVSPARLNRHIPIRLFDVIDLVGIPKARPDRALIWIRSSAMDDGRSGRLHEINTRRSLEPMLADTRGGSTLSPGQLSESVTKTYPAPDGLVLGYAADLDGEPAFAFRFLKNTVTYAYWDGAAQAWRDPPPAREKILPIARDPDPTYAWVATRDPAAGSQLRRMELATGAYLDPIHTDREFDLSEADLVFSRRSRTLVGFHHVRQRSQSRWLSPVFTELQQALDQKLPPDEDHRIVEFSDAEDRFLVKSSGPRQPGVFYLYDLKTQTLSRLGEVAPDLMGKSLLPARTVTFKARDGLALEAYLTIPAGISRNKPAPLVVLPHGGPHVRDAWHFDPEVQFLASRGYAVLQPNYRGSSGYLWPEESDDYKGAFVAMRDDVTDATRAALRSGLFDPARVAIMGGSFGGYLAIAAPVEEPGLFRCAVSVCGVFDWAEHVKSKRFASGARPAEYASLTSLLGDPKKDEAAYDALSPLGRIDRFRIPVLIAHGREDRIVSVKQSRMLARELKKRGIPHETFYRSLAGHGFYAAKDRLAFYETLDRFLAENLASPASVATP